MSPSTAHAAVAPALPLAVHAVVVHVGAAAWDLRSAEEKRCEQCMAQVAPAEQYSKPSNVYRKALHRPQIEARNALLLTAAAK